MKHATAGDALRRIREAHGQAFPRVQVVWDGVSVTGSKPQGACASKPAPVLENVQAKADPGRLTMVRKTLREHSLPPAVLGGASKRSKHAGESPKPCGKISSPACRVAQHHESSSRSPHSPPSPPTAMPYHPWGGRWPRLLGQKGRREHDSLHGCREKMTMLTTEAASAEALPSGSERE